MTERTLTRTSRAGHAHRQRTPATTFPRQTYAHDHAWRRISGPGEEPALLEGRYRCDLCCAEWAL